MRFLIVLFTLLSACAPTPSVNVERAYKLGCTYALYSHFTLSRLTDEEFDWVYTQAPCESVNMKKGTLNDPWMRAENRRSF